MENVNQRRKITDFEPIGSDKISCGASCAGKLAEENSDNKFVCSVLSVPAKGHLHVVRGTEPEEMRICTELNP